MSENASKTHSFQAEVQQVLDIVIHSLYTHRDIFLRELISNASDALEKIRYTQSSGEAVHGADQSLQIEIKVDENAKIITISDSGAGMNEAEAIENLGTIAHSGTKEFVKAIQSARQDGANLIGQFGVGFYSSFMVAKKVVVRSRSYRPEDAALEWASEGAGEFEIQPVEKEMRGTDIILHLRDDAEEYASKETLSRIVKDYSNFVPFPISIDGDEVNTIQAIWTRNKNEVSDEEYNEFYKFVSKAFDEPMYRLHFTSDAPLQVSSILFVPDDHFERMGLGKMDPGVNLYCRRVLIQANTEVLFPDWMRFVKGAVDSEDLPLNISRETLQDNAVVRKLGRVMTGRFLKFLNEQAMSDAEKYETFWNRFGMFLKEGVSSDPENKAEIAKLLRFRSSKEEKDQWISLADYVARMKGGQDTIYYLNGPTRDSIESGPYMEAFQKRDIEVIYVHEPVDDFVLNMIQEFDGKKIRSADQADLDLPDLPETEDSESDEKPSGMTKEESEQLSGWFKNVLGDRIASVRESKRLTGSPALVVSSDTGMSAQMQKMIQSMNAGAPSLQKIILEINPSHPLIQKIARLKDGEQNEFAKMAAEHVLDTAMAAAGLLTDQSAMIGRNYDILNRALDTAVDSSE